MERVLINKISLYKDNRGSNIKPRFTEKIKEELVSKSKKNVARGIHKSPYAKHVTVLSGKITDYVIDFTTNPPTWNKYSLSEEKNNYIFIPANMGHFFITHDETILLYQLEGNYNSEKDENINYLDPYINLDIEFDNNYIISEKDKNSNFYKKIDYILLGSNGFLGSETKKYLKKQNKNFISLNTRLENYQVLENQINFYKPRYVICAAGISGKPTIEWCESNKKVTLETNLTSILNLCKICDDNNIHLTIYGSGSVFKNNGFERSEDEEPDNYSKYYLECRILLEKSIKIYKNVLLLRIQYPISFNHKNCFMSKMLTRRENVHDINVNITFLPSLLPLLTEIIEKQTSGILNFVNKGEISLPCLMDIYIKYKDKNFTYLRGEKKVGCGILSTKKIENITEIEILETSLINYLIKNEKNLVCT